MSLAVKASGDLTSEDRSSGVSTATLTLSGIWGDHAAPAIVSATASDAGSSAGLNTGDKITIVFDRHTNVRPVSTKAEVDTLLASVRLLARHTPAAGCRCLCWSWS